MTESETVFFDGSCGLCHGFVRFVIRRDRGVRFVFGPLGGETFRAAFPGRAASRLPESVVVRTRDGRTLVRSDAVVHVLRALGGGARCAGTCLRVVPRPLRDLGYRAVARVRRALLAPPREACPVVPPELQRRFLP